MQIVRTGRYIESDLIGLKGGINTYAYAGENSLKNIDVEGLATQFCAGRPTTYLHFWLCANGKCAGLEPAGTPWQGVTSGPGAIEPVSKDAKASICTPAVAGASVSKTCDQSKFEACVAANLTPRYDCKRCSRLS